MAEERPIDLREYEERAMKESLIIALVGLLIFIALVIYGFKKILGI